MQTRAVMVLCLAGMLLALPASGQRAAASLSVDSAAIGERFTLTLYALHDSDSSASFPTAGASDSIFGDLAVIGVRERGSRELESGRLDSIVYNVASFALDAAIVPPIAVSFDGGAVVDSTPALIMPMISVLPPDAAEIRDIADIAEFGQPIWPYVLLGLAALAAIGLGIYFLRRPRKPLVLVDGDLPGPSPYDVAIRELQLLARTPPKHDLEVKPFHVKLSIALRTYLEDTLNVPAMEQTTSELLQEFGQPAVRHLVPGPVPTRTHEVLELADLVKFANYLPESPRHSESANTALEIVKRVQTKVDQLNSEPEE